MALIKRSDVNRPLTIEEMDNNFSYLEDLVSNIPSEPETPNEGIPGASYLIYLTPVASKKKGVGIIQIDEPIYSKTIIILNEEFPVVKFIINADMNCDGFSFGLGTISFSAGPDREIHSTGETVEGGSYNFFRIITIEHPEHPEYGKFDLLILNMGAPRPPLGDRQVKG